MQKVNCDVINFSKSTYKTNKWRREICYEHNDSDSSCKREDCIILQDHHYTVPSILRLQS